MAEFEFVLFSLILVFFPVVFYKLLIKFLKQTEYSHQYVEFTYEDLISSRMSYEEFVISSHSLVKNRFFFNS